MPCLQGIQSPIFLLFAAMHTKGPTAIGARAQFPPQFRQREVTVSTEDLPELTVAAIR